MIAGLMEVAPLGDSALVVRFGDGAGDLLTSILAAQQRLNDAKIQGIIETAPGIASLGVYYDPLRIASSGVEPDRILEWLTVRVQEALSPSAKSSARHLKIRELEIPVSFDPDFALDLDEVARRAGMERSEVIDSYCDASYRVNCIGFTPGFPYLSGLPDKLATPRRPIPRQKIPDGSVAIGGDQTGIYPMKSPGGWNVIGRTPICLFNPSKNPPAFLRAGDRVRFRSISREEFERLAT